MYVSRDSLAYFGKDSNGARGQLVCLSDSLGYYSNDFILGGDFGFI